MNDFVFSYFLFHLWYVPQSVKLAESRVLKVKIVAKFLLSVLRSFALEKVVSHKAAKDTKQIYPVSITTRR